MASRLLHYARRASLRSPSRLQYLIRPLSPSPQLQLPSSSTFFFTLARGYIAEMRRSAFQENLLRILRTEIDYEIDVRPPQEVTPNTYDWERGLMPSAWKPVQTFESFSVQDRPGERWITLRKQLGQHDVKVDVTMFDYAISVPSDAKVGESSGDDMKLHISSLVDVGKAGSSYPILQFICSAWPEGMEIEHVRVVEQDHPSLYPFMGPKFKDMDEELQNALEEFLERAGVNDELAVFLHQYMMQKDRREYVRWMEKLKAYVEK